MLIFYILAALTVPLLVLAFVIWQFRQAARSILGIIQLNIGGDGPTKRLFPNFAFFGLFLLLINLTWF